MKGVFNVDPHRCECGPATASVRSILLEWMDIAWFVRPKADADVRALRSLRDYHALAGICVPECFPINLGVRVARGGWADFHALREYVCKPGRTWDWKYGALKRLSSEHAKRHGFSLHDQAAPPLGHKAGLADLFFRVGDLVFWQSLHPKLSFQEAATAEDVGWYLGYATRDATDAIQWQLAEGNNDTRGNPFLPLLRCYSEGYYPFSLGPSEVVLFGLDA